MTTADPDLLAYASTLAREAVQTITLRTIRNRAPNHLGRALTVEEGMAIAEALANADIEIR